MILPAATFAALRPFRIPAPPAVREEMTTMRPPAANGLRAECANPARKACVAVIAMHDAKSSSAAGFMGFGSPIHNHGDHHRSRGRSSPQLQSPRGVFADGNRDDDRHGWRR